MRTRFNFKLCECGCGKKVRKFRGKWRRFRAGHHTRTPKLREVHSRRMRGNTLFEGFTHSKSARNKIAKSQTGKTNSIWNNGRTIASGGYVMILHRTHPYRDVNNRIREERLIMEEHLDRYLKPYETVHHKNEIKIDNRLENLEVMTRSEHRSHHARKMIVEGKFGGGRIY